MSQLENSLSRFSADQCCGTAVLRYLGNGVFCLVSSACTGDCEPSGIPIDCTDINALEIGDTVTTYCRPTACNFSAVFPDCEDDPDPNDPACDGECWIKYQDDEDGTCTICIFLDTCVRDPGDPLGPNCNCDVQDCDVDCGGAEEPVPGEIVRIACVPGPDSPCEECP